MTRWIRVEGLLRKWYAAPLGPADAGDPRELEQTLPLALQEWWRLAGGRLLEPFLRDGLTPGVTVHLSEGGYDRAWVRLRDLKQEDPPVYGWDEEEEELRVAPSFSEWVLFQALSGAVRPTGEDDEDLAFGPRGDWVRWRSRVSRRAVAKLQATLARLPLEPRDGWEFWGDADTIVAVAAPDTVRAATRTPLAWDRLDALLRP
ncbi:MAG: hypothetical protein R3F62_15710 [Planctomycetota bacterium]